MTCKTQSFYILLNFVLISITLLIAVSIYCYPTKYRNTYITISCHKITRILCWQYQLKMSNKVKDINIKNRTYYFFNDIINIENFDPDNIKIDENSCKDILI